MQQAAHYSLGHIKDTYQSHSSYVIMLCSIFISNPLTLNIYSSLMLLHISMSIGNKNFELGW